MQVRIKRVNKSFPLPEYQTAGAAAFDLYSRVEARIAPGEIADLPSNVIIAVPEGYFLLIAARSSLSKKGLALANGVGVSDPDFRGPDDEIKLRLINFTKEPVSVKAGERLAQGLILPVQRVEWEEREQMEEKSRGGFGSTG